MVQNLFNSPVLSIVIPAYNEESGIASIIERVLSIQPSLVSAGVHGLELIVVDDGSKDQTAAIASEAVQAHPCAYVIQHKKNQGYGGALKTGFSQAHGDLIGFLDADGTYPPEYFPALCRAALNGSELVVGSRMSGAESKMPLTRRIGNLFFANLLSVLGRQKITDSASGMRVFKRSVLDRVYPLPDGLNLTPVMSARAIHEGIPMSEIPIPYSERLGRSKLSVFRDGSIFLSSILWTVMVYNPVRILGSVGLAGVLFAALVVAGLFIARIMGVTTLQPWNVALLYASLVTGVAGASIFALGATFNYLVSLFYKKPIRQGLFGKPLFNPPLEHYFGRLGILSFTSGLLLGITSTALSVSGWDIERLWLYLLGSAMLILSGVQLVLYRLLMQALQELSQREQQVQQDLDHSF